MNDDCASAYRVLLFASAALVLLSGSVSAATDGYEYGAYALMIAVFFLALAYAASYLFGMPHIRPILNDELLQVLVTGGVLLLLIGFSVSVDIYLSAALNATSTTGYGALTLHQVAQNVLGSIDVRDESILNSLSAASDNLGKEGSKGIYCNFLGVGFTMVNCSPLNAYRGGLTTAAFAAATALADTFAQQYIVSLGQSLGFTFLIPFGLFLRCFKITRRAGGALIAIGFGFYTVYPLVIVATEKMLHEGNPLAPASIAPYGECEPGETNVDVVRDKFLNYGRNDLADFNKVENFAYILLVRSLFGSILNLIITLGFVRTFAHLLGSEIDVSGLARIS